MKIAWIGTCLDKPLMQQLAQKGHEPVWVRPFWVHYCRLDSSLLEQAQALIVGSKHALGAFDSASWLKFKGVVVVPGPALLKQVKALAPRAHVVGPSKDNLGIQSALQEASEPLAGLSRVLVLTPFYGMKISEGDNADSMGGMAQACKGFFGSSKGVYQAAYRLMPSAFDLQQAMGAKTLVIGSYVMYQALLEHREAPLLLKQAQAVITPSLKLQSLLSCSLVSISVCDLSFDEISAALQELDAK